MGGKRPRGRKGNTDASPGIRLGEPRSSTDAQSSLRLVVFTVALVIHSTKQHFFVIVSNVPETPTRHISVIDNGLRHSYAINEKQRWEQGYSTHTTVLGIPRYLGQFGTHLTLPVTGFRPQKHLPVKR